MSRVGSLLSELLNCVPRRRPNLLSQENDCPETIPGTDDSPVELVPERLDQEDESDGVETADDKPESSNVHRPTRPTETRKKDEYEFPVSLIKENLVVGIWNGVPVLRIAHGFTDDDMTTCRVRNKFTTIIHNDWEETIVGGDLSDEDYKHIPEPVIDGLPFSMWEECMERSLGALVKVSTMKHRRTNISNTQKSLTIEPAEEDDSVGDILPLFGPVMPLNRLGAFALPQHLANNINLVNGIHRRFLESIRPEAAVNPNAQYEADRDIRNTRNRRVWRRDLPLQPA